MGYVEFAWFPAFLALRKCLNLFRRVIPEEKVSKMAQIGPQTAEIEPFYSKIRPF